jgi:rhamnogalacturonyl hydrolase YesR
MSDPIQLESIQRLDAWLVQHDFQAYDPFDGLNAWLRPLALGRLGRQLLQQGVRRCPLNLRPLLGIRPAPSSKGYGYLARGYLTLYRHTGDPGCLAKADTCLDWLAAQASPTYGGLSWGNHFDYQSRVFYLPRGTPTIVWVSLIGQAFVDAWEVTGRPERLEIARAACDFIMTGLERRPAGQGVCLSYIPGQFRSVHNASMLGAALLARVAAHTGQAELVDVARQAVDYTVGAQLPSGAWWYGEADNLHWIDSFHTGYVLAALAGYAQATGDHRHDAAFARGADFFIEHFFLPDGTPRYYAQRTWPIDIQCAAQAIETLTLLARLRQAPALHELARHVACWTITHMQDESGYFYFQRLPGLVNRTPTLHWGQATMLHTLAGLLVNDTDAKGSTP